MGRGDEWAWMSRVRTQQGRRDVVQPQNQTSTFKHLPPVIPKSAPSRSFSWWLLQQKFSQKMWQKPSETVFAQPLCGYFCRTSQLNELFYVNTFWLILTWDYLLFLVQLMVFIGNMILWEVDHKFAHPQGCNGTVKFAASLRYLQGPVTASNNFCLLATKWTLLWPCIPLFLPTPPQKTKKNQILTIAFNQQSHMCPTPTPHNYCPTTRLNGAGLGSSIVTMSNN